MNWRGFLYRIGLALAADLDQAESDLHYARNDLKWAERRFQSMQREIDARKAERLVVGADEFDEIVENLQRPTKPTELALRGARLLCELGPTGSRPPADISDRETV